MAVLDNAACSDPGEGQPAERRTVPAAAPMDLSDARILVVDDTPSARMLIAAFLGSAGFANVVQAESGAKALEEVDRAKPDLIILDLMMPGMDGFEVCRRLRARNDTLALPVLIQSARGENDAIRLAFEAGASDMVSKPINQIEFISRVRAHLSSQALYSELETYRARMTRELADARDMQMEICPSVDDLAAIERNHGYRVACRFDPSSELGGDVWGLLPAGEGCFGFYLADFSGHGVAAALNTFRLHTLISQSTDLGCPPSEILGQLNRHLRRILRTGQFATMLLGFVDVAARRFRYAAAGAPPFLLVPEDGASAVRVCETRGLPLGISTAVRYEDRDVALPSGTRLFAYSDVVIETVDADGAMLDVEGLLALIDRERGRVPGVDLVDTVVAALHRHAGDTLKDDLTVVCIQDHARAGQS